MMSEQKVNNLCLGLYYQDTETLENLYSPSRWSHRFSDPEDVISHHVALCVEESKRVKSSIPCQLAVAYGERSRSKLDIFGSDLPLDSPVFVYIPGGYWQCESGETSSYPVEPMYRNGIMTVVIDYNRAPGITVTEIGQQVVTAMEWIFAFATVARKARSIVFAGHSAGGQLCAKILASEWFSMLPWSSKEVFKGVIFLAGVFDLTPLVTTSTNDALQMSSTEAQHNSPLFRPVLNATLDSLKQVRKGFRIMICAGEHDSPAFIEQGRFYAKKLAEGGPKHVRIEDRLIMDADHFNLVTDLRLESYEVTKLIIGIIMEEDKK